jgi:hypothetical protein
MNRLESKIVFFLTVLIGLKIVDFLLSAFYYDILQLIHIEYNEEVYRKVSDWFPYFTNLIFAIILLIYCRLEIKNKIVIPVLGLFHPVIGLVFYFIESELMNQNSKETRNG